MEEVEKEDSKWKKFREVIKNPPTDRLCLINARAYQLGIIAYLFVGIMLIIRTEIWYLALIFVFTMVNNWVGYKREMKQYANIQKARALMNITDYIADDPSPSRRRLRTVKEAGLLWINWVLTGILAALGAYFFSQHLTTILNSIIFFISLIIAYIIILFFITYPIAKRRLNNHGDV